MSKLSYGEWELVFKSSSKPREVVIEVTTECNYSCIHCFRNLMFNEGLGRMSRNTFNNLVNGLSDAGIEKVVISGWGEPLTHPEIISFINELKDLGLYVVLNTNGSLIGKYVDALFKAEVDEVVVSVDSVETDVYKSIRVGGALGNVLDGILRLNELKGYKLKPYLTMWFTINALNVDDIPKVPSFARSLGFRKIVFSHIIPHSKKYEDVMAMYIRDRLTDDKLSEVFSKISKEVLATGGYVVMPKHRFTVERSCPFIANNAMFVRWDGYVTPCINYAHNWRNTFLQVDRTINAVKFGNVDEEKLVDIWRKDRYVLFRLRTAFFLQPSCLDCSLSQYCSYTLTNMMDCWGNTPTCAHCPYSHHITMCPL